MGREQRARIQTHEQQAAEIAQYIDHAIGPVLRFRVHDGLGCPKCGVSPEAFKKDFCHGNNPIFGAENKCHVIGQHLHGLCRACQFQWREQTKDAEEMGELAAKLEAAPLIIGAGGSA